MSMKFLLFLAAVIIEFGGCALLFVDVLITRKTDFCQDPVAADYLGYRCNKETGLFVLAVPEFSYTYEGKKYEGPSANQFWHLYRKPGTDKWIVPFVDGKSYGIYVNPYSPGQYVTAGEQRMTALHALSITIVLVGAAFLWFVMGLPEA